MRCEVKLDFQNRAKKLTRSGRFTAHKCHTSVFLICNQQMLPWVIWTRSVSDFAFSVHWPCWECCCWSGIIQGTLRGHGMEKRAAREQRFCSRSRSYWGWDVRMRLSMKWDQPTGPQAFPSLFSVIFFIPKEIEPTLCHQCPLCQRD